MPHFLREFSAAYAFMEWFRMNNGFYNEFDCERLPGYPHRQEDERHPFQRDRDRILYSAAFRRLQAKTQVFQPGEYDFYRTRLTHSIETAQIGRSICRHLRQQRKPLRDGFHVDSDLVEAACLAHDLGHPPFGHSGEEALHRLMKPYGGFEGNAQTLRLVTELFYRKGGGFAGMAPTRGFLDGIMKYKCLHKEQKRQNHFLYDDQKPYRDFLSGKTATDAKGKSDTKPDESHSLECQIMDWADDTAYGLNDLADGIRAGFLTGDVLEQWAGGRALDKTGCENVEKIIETIRENRFEPFLASRIGKFIQACRVEPRRHPMARRTSRYAYQLVIDEKARAEADFYKKIASEIIFLSPQIEQLRYKGRWILDQLFAVLADHYLCARKPLRQVHLLPGFYENQIRQARRRKDKARLLCDYLAGMTDGFAIRFWKRLFDPSFGSIADLA